MLPNYQARSPFVLKHTTSKYIYLGLEIVLVLAWAYVCTFSTMRLRGPDNLLSNILFCLPAVRSSDAR